MSWSSCDLDYEIKCFDGAAWLWFTCPRCGLCQLGMIDEKALTAGDAEVVCENDDECGKRNMVITLTVTVEARMVGLLDVPLKEVDPS